MLPLSSNSLANRKQRQSGKSCWREPTRMRPPGAVPSDATIWATRPPTCSSCWSPYSCSSRFPWPSPHSSTCSATWDCSRASRTCTISSWSSFCATSSSCWASHSTSPFTVACLHNSGIHSSRCWSTTCPAATHFWHEPQTRRPPKRKPSQQHKHRPTSTGWGPVAMERLPRQCPWLPWTPTPEMEAKSKTFDLEIKTSTCMHTWVPPAVPD